MTAHGYVTPRPDGRIAKCGGPHACPDCREEYRERYGREWTPETTGTRTGADLRASRAPR